MSHQTEAFEGKLAVVGLGYVGLPLAVAFSESMDVIGYDVDALQGRGRDNRSG